MSIKYGDDPDGPIVGVGGFRPCGRADCEEWFLPATPQMAGRQLYCSPRCKKLDRCTRLMEDGKCPVCERRNQDAGTHWRCSDCRARLAAHMRATRAQRKAAAVCLDCRQPVAGKLVRCAVHKLANGRAVKKWTASAQLRGYKRARRKSSPALGKPTRSRAEETGNPQGELGEAVLPRPAADPRGEEVDGGTGGVDPR